MDKTIGKVKTAGHDKANDRHGQSLSHQDFQRLSRYISTNFGIKMPEEKKIMLEGRLQKRLNALNIPTFDKYCSYFFSEEGQKHEVMNMIDMVSINKTSFFRENDHFLYLRDELLPKLIRSNRQGPLKIWSAACSTGEENYSISMAISDFKDQNRIIDYRVLGTDISTEALTVAMKAVYTENRVADIPFHYRKNYLLRSKKQDNTTRIVPGIRSKNTFRLLNLMEPVYSEIPQNFDIIFCRNVLIYFDRPTQESIIQKICLHLRSGGIFFLGHSESILGMNVPLRQIRPTIFQKN